MDLQQRDQAAVWHPFTPQTGKTPEIPIVRGEGACFYDSSGKRYIDAIASWWVNLHGHCHPYLTQKIGEQLATLEHAIFSGFTHEPGIVLAERLLKRLPDSHKKIFYSDNGSTAVEVGLKMAFQYWSNRGSARTVVIALENAYHGDTFGGMSVGARNAFNKPFYSLLFDVVHIPVPLKGKEEHTLQLLREEVAKGNVASFIFEPLVQGAGGMLMYEAAVLDQMIAICQEAKVITIADEVMTGFGRTGKFFAADHLLNQPDIICMSKGLTGGVMPLGATSCKAFIHDAYRTEEKMKTFFHGHSYTGNPTSCAAALASLDLLDLPETEQNIQRIILSHKRFAETLRGHPAIRELRQLGTILAIELRSAEETGYLNPLAEEISVFFIARGIILRPLGNIVYILPPYCISDSELAEVYAAISDFCKFISGKR